MISPKKKNESLMKFYNPKVPKKNEDGMPSSTI